MSIYSTCDESKKVKFISVICSQLRNKELKFVTVSFQINLTKFYVLLNKYFDFTSSCLIPSIMISLGFIDVYESLYTWCSFWATLIVIKEIFDSSFWHINWDIIIMIYIKIIKKWFSFLFFNVFIFIFNSSIFITFFLLFIFDLAFGYSLLLFSKCVFLFFSFIFYIYLF